VVAYTVYLRAKINVAYSAADEYAISYYLRAEISVIYSTADASAIDLFIDLRSASVCMQSGSYFPNPREFSCLEYMPPSYSSQHIYKVLFLS
jgi:hypothetical protein